jgi:Zn-dependent protease
MSWTLSFRVAGVPVEVQPAFWLGTFALASSRLGAPHYLLSWIAVVFASVLVHEMGHALVLQRLGHRASIELGMLGGAAMGAGRGLTATGSLLVSIAGPLAGFTVGIPLLLLSLIPGLTEIPFLGVVLSDLVFVTIAWGLLNLLPIWPLDGGQATLAILTLKSWATPTRLVHKISIAVAVVGSLVALLLGEIYVAAGFAALAGYNIVIFTRIVR